MLTSHTTMLIRQNLQSNRTFSLNCLIWHHCDLELQSRSGQEQVAFKYYCHLNCDTDSVQDNWNIQFLPWMNGWPANLKLMMAQFNIMSAESKIDCYNINVKRDGKKRCKQYITLKNSITESITLQFSFTSQTCELLQKYKKIHKTKKRKRNQSFYDTLFFSTTGRKHTVTHKFAQLQGSNIKHMWDDKFKYLGSKDKERW